MEDIAFPRGGRPQSTKPVDTKDDDQPKRRERPSEIKKKRKAEQESPDFLFGSKPSSESTTKSKKTKQSQPSTTPVTAKHSLLPLGGGGVFIPQYNNNNTKKDGKKGTAPIIEALSFQKLSKGTKLLGYVREVQDEFAVFSLPNLLTGFMLRSAVAKKTGNSDDSDAITGGTSLTSLKQCLAVGQILTVAVQRVAKEELSGGVTKKRIQVSALPTHVNPKNSNSNNNKNSMTSTTPIRGQILSVEDHGCLVDLGMGRQGFLKFDQVEGDYIVLEADEDDDVDPEHSTRKGRILQPGRLYDFTVVNQVSVTPKEGTASIAILPLKLSKDVTLSQHMVTPQANVAVGANNHSSTTTPSYTLSSLLPGMMVTAKVEAIAKNGLCVTFLGNVFRGAIELGSHMGGHEFLSGGGGDENNNITNNVGKTNSNLKQELEHAWRKVFDHHQHFPARIIAVDVPSKMIRLSIASHILTMKPPPKVGVGVGAIVKECTVVRVDQGIGALLALPKEYHLTTENLLPKRLVKKSDLFQNETFLKAMAVPAVYVHISKAYDDDEQGKKGKKNDKTSSRHEINLGQFTKDFGLGSKHSVRILNTGHWIDGVASGGCSPAVLDAHVLTHADLQPGQLYRQVPVCAKLAGGSILVNLGGSPGNPVRGLIPSPLHLMDKPAKSSSDFHKKVLETKFAIDAKVDVRVLWVDHAKKKCVVTAKKSLVKIEEDQVVTSYETLKVGTLATGFVSKIDDRGLYVTFCDRVYGKVTAKSLAYDLGIENHLDNYQVGDVVPCRVVKITKNKGKLRGPDDEYDDDMADEMETEDQNNRAFYQVLLSLKVGGDDMDEDEDDMDRGKAQQVEETEPHNVRVKAGAVLPEKSLKIVELFKGKQRGNSFVPGYAIVSIKSKYLLDDSVAYNMLPQMECKLPFDQLLDDYEPADIESLEALDALAARTLRVGKKINQKAIVLSDPHKTNVDHSSGVGKLTVVSLRKGLIATMEGVGEDDMESAVVPTPASNLFVGALVKGYVAQVDVRHGAFLRFLDGMTGLIPRMNGGLDLMPYSTIVAKVQVVDDTVRPYRIMLQPVTGTKRKDIESTLPFKVGDKIAKAHVTAVHFLEVRLEVLDGGELDLNNVSLRLHASMKTAREAKIKLLATKIGKGQIVKGHPFYGLNPDDELNNLTVVSVSRVKGKVVVQVTDREASGDENELHAPILATSRSQLKAGMTVSAFVSEIHDKNKGLSVWVNPSVKGFIPGLELSKDLDVLNNISKHVPLGAKLICVVMDDSQWHENRAKIPFASRTQKSWSERKSTPDEKRELYLSVVAVNEPTLAIEKPMRNDLIIGRINKQLPQYMGPSLMLTLRGGFLARCCITELAECDDWENMPLGNSSVSKKVGSPGETKTVDVGGKIKDESEDESSESGDGEQAEAETDNPFSDGSYLQCRVLKAIPKQSLVEVSLRESRVEGDLDEDEVPPEGETVQAFVIETNKKGCFVRLARHIEGRATLTELCDGFLQNPEASFPPGRLVVGRIKNISSIPKTKSSKNPAKFKADLDMRETSLLGTKKAISFEDIEINAKYKGTVSRIESYGVFVQLENSKVSGLVHLSECSDGFVKNIAALYDPGDLVKVLVIKKDDDEKKIGFSMKASHFEDDKDSDDDSSVSYAGDGVDDTMEVDEVIKAYSDLDSEDEDFTSKLASKITGEGNEHGSGNGESTGSEDESDSEPESEEGDEKLAEKLAIDTDVGFDWGFDGMGKPKDKGNDPTSSDDSDSEDDGPGKSASHSSRKKQAHRRREEQEISKRELALADGTADANPETAGDFERLLAGNPNSSELWIRYMAFHLSVADISSARMVAEKAIDRIDFREEREKLNVWTALLTVEHKYGTDSSLRTAIERACGQNNPKQVYLRACEILEKDLSTAESVAKADAMYQKMCAKFKSKKKVWLAHLTYLLKQSRNEEAHALLKRALLSLAPHKHAETMCKFAQLEYEFGIPERARTIFDGIVAKYPKRLDLFYIYVDKEIKFGSFATARALLQNKVNGAKLTDKQVKGLFKKWFHLEERHGDEDSMEHVKDCARKYVQKTSDIM